MNRMLLDTASVSDKCQFKLRDHSVLPEVLDWCKTNGSMTGLEFGDFPDTCQVYNFSLK